MFSVCSTRPVHGAAKYSSRWRAVFQANVADAAVGGDPERVEHAAEAAGARPPSRRTSMRSRPVAVAVTTSLCPKYCSARSNRCGDRQRNVLHQPLHGCRSYCSPARPDPTRTSRQVPDDVGQQMRRSIGEHTHLNRQHRPWPPTRSAPHHPARSSDSTPPAPANHTANTVTNPASNGSTTVTFTTTAAAPTGTPPRPVTTNSNTEPAPRTTTTSEQPIHRRVRRPRIQQPRRTQRRIPRPRRQVPDDVGQQMRRGIGEHTHRTAGTDLGHQLIRHHLTRPEVQIRRHRHRRPTRRTPSRTPPPTDPPPSRSPPPHAAPTGTPPRPVTTNSNTEPAPRRPPPANNPPPSSSPTAYPTPAPDSTAHTPAPPAGTRRRRPTDASPHR